MPCGIVPKRKSQTRKPNQSRRIPGEISISNPDNDQIPRRQFAKYLTGAGIVAAFGGAIIFIRARKNSYPVKVVAHVGDIPIGGVKIISYPNDEHPCFLLHPSEGTFLAFSRLCTHAACPTFYRPEERVFACPCHGGVFSAIDGSVLAGPPPKPLPRVQLELRGQDLVAIGVSQRNE
jgi:nitrite reductase/ring-hydroxylating ferredoxin subunit